jgi:3-hydroxymyristoyl/3-hydroxydecanoyl-(acyl carrier protein) dehydratase
LIRSAQEDRRPVLLPELLGKKTESDSLVLTLRIPETLAYFAGHFDTVPIVPGVVQIQWAVYYAGQYLALKRTFSHMDVVKFKELLLPGQHVNLSLSYLEAGSKLTFCYQSETTEYSSGRIYFHDAPL